MRISIEQWWRDLFGVDATEELWPNGVHVQAHHAGGPLADYEGVWVTQRASSCRISSPPQLSETVSAIASNASPYELLTGTPMRSLFGPTTKVLGPSVHAYASRETLTSRDSGNVREVNSSALNELRSKTHPAEWAESGFAGQPDRCFALFDHGQIVAAASLNAWITPHSDIGLLVHSTHRGRGFGSTLAAAVAQIAASESSVVRYRALKTNTASVSVLNRIGFTVYCEQTAIRAATNTEQ